MFNPENKNPYAGTGVVQLEAAKAGAAEAARKAAEKEANGGVPTFTQSEGQAASRSTMLKDSLESFENIMNSPNVSPMNMAAADTVAKMGPIGTVIADKNIRTPDEQRFNVAKAAALEGMASAVTGAGVTKDQFDRFTSILPTGSEDPAVRQEKLLGAYKFLRTQATLSGPLGSELGAYLDSKIQALSKPQSPSIKRFNPKTGKLE
jgi:hypothetical protein